jgi:hypothetical protein
MLQGESGPDFIASNGWLDRSPESQRRQFVILLLLLAVFVLLQCALPLASAIKIGADEDFAVQKAFLSLKGYRMYTDIWDDQPPLHTYLLKQVFLHISNSIFAARLLSVGAAVVLLSALFFLALRVGGILAASIATGLLIASPGFLELSASAMVEIPGLAPAVAALCLLYTGPVTRWRVVEVLAGTVFAFALQIKAIEALYLPLAGLILWLRDRGSSAVLRNWLWSAMAFGLTAVIGFLAVNHLTGESLTAQIAQARASHFTAAASVEYGSPADHPFDWAVLTRNWDTTIPALAGVLYLVRLAIQQRSALLPLTWLGLTLLIFGTYKPWWSYYYIHTALPLCWCAGVGVAWVWQALRAAKRRTLYAFSGTFVACALAWVGGRVWLQANSIRQAPRIESSLVLKEIKRYKPFTKFLFTTEAVYAFHADIPIPPKIATLSLKRLWTGDMTNEKLADEMRALRPGVLLLANDSKELPFQSLLQTEYRLVYTDAQHRLYVLPEIIEQAEPW